MKIEKDYEDLLKLLNENKVRFCIIGAYAVGFYAVPRYTKDLDILIEPTERNARQILHALDEFGFRSLKLSMEDFMSKDAIIQLGYEPLRIDLITSIPSCSFNQIWKNKKKAVYGNTKVFFIGINELIKSKQKTGRKVDKLDAEILKKVKNRKYSSYKKA